MSKPKITEGPLHVHDNGQPAAGLNWSVRDVDGNPIAYYHRKEDAALGVAAPELLAALKAVDQEIYRAHNGDDSVSYQRNGLWDAIRAALAKAERSR